MSESHTIIKLTNNILYILIAVLISLTSSLLDNYQVIANRYFLYFSLILHQKFQFGQFLDEKM